jgi:tRNA threonylcarbamoyladenosine modification (KEOPS) complex  Pcc1 subunit
MSVTKVKSKTTLEIPLESEQQAGILYSALIPETESAPSDRAKAQVIVDGSSLIIEIEAGDLTATRAALNSFIAWISACIRTIENIDTRSPDAKP